MQAYPQDSPQFVGRLAISGCVPSPSSFQTPFSPAAGDILVLPLHPLVGLNVDNHIKNSILRIPLIMYLCMPLLMQFRQQKTSKVCDISSGGFRADNLSRRMGTELPTMFLLLWWIQRKKPMIFLPLSSFCVPHRATLNSTACIILSPKYSFGRNGPQDRRKNPSLLVTSNVTNPLKFPSTSLLQSPPSNFVPAVNLVPPLPHLTIMPCNSWGQHAAGGWVI